MPGKVYLVGAGPGDPGLLTLKGKVALERADCVIYDFLANEALLRHTRADCEKIYVGKRAGRHTMSQDRINRLLIDKARQGLCVVRLKGGDPFIFGRGGEEAMELSLAGIPFEVVPGVSAGHAAPAYAGIPLTHRDLASSACFLTGHEEPSDPDSPLAKVMEDASITRKAQTLVFFMGARTLSEIAALLLKQGCDPSIPAAVIRWGTTPNQEVVTGTLADIASKSASIQPPALTVIGEVVRLREKLRWFERLPLFGKRIVITRAREQASPLREALAERGAEVVEIPTIEIRNPDSWNPLDDAIRRLEEFDFLLATSVNGVRNFMARLKACGRDARDLKGLEIGAIGPATTKEFESAGVRVDFMPSEYRAEGLLDVLEGRDLTGKAFLIPRARIARDLVPQTLRERGAQVEVIEAYYTAAPEYKPEELEALLIPPPDVVTFTSSSTVMNFAKLPFSEKVRTGLKNAQNASIGPVTSETLRNFGMNVNIEAKVSTILGLVQAIEDSFRDPS
jgi:uroporphyrinogen III methyltransferase/synthase